jgi:hypothetical protein
MAFGVNNAEDVRTTDFPKAVRDWPDLKFCAYHSGYFSPGDHPQGLDGSYHPENEPENPGRWGNMEFITQVESIPKKLRKNVYAEIGTTFAITVAQDPKNLIQAAHFLGRLLNTFGSKNILWGTDSIWWGSPQYYIDTFWNMQMPAELRETYGYPALTEKVKRRILGQNAARLYGLKKPDRRGLCTISPDRFEQIQQAQGGARAARDFRFYGAQTRRQFLTMFGHKLHPTIG